MLSYIQTYIYKHAYIYKHTLHAAHTQIYKHIQVLSTCIPAYRLVRMFLVHDTNDDISSCIQLKEIPQYCGKVRGVFWAPQLL